MSHVATIKAELKNLSALKSASKALGLELKEQKTYRWFGRSVGDYPLPEGIAEKDLGKCDYAISIPNDSKAYEIGVVKKEKGFTLVWDFWQGGYGMQAIVGKNAQFLTQRYQLEVAKQHLPFGFQVQERKQTNGTIVLEAYR